MKTLKQDIDILFQNTIYIFAVNILLTFQNIDAIYFFISNSIIKFKEVVCEKMVFIALRFDLIINLCKNLSLLFTTHIGEQKLFFTSGSMNSAAKRYPYFLQSNAYAGKRCGHIIYTSAHSRKKVP